MMISKQVSVIIVSYNVQDFLDLCLDAVLKATRNTDAEIFVVDNASSDGSVSLVRSKYPGVRLIANDDNVGFSKANNQALRESCGRFVHFLNPDTIIPEDFYTRCLAYMEQHPDTGALGPRIIDADGQYAPDSKKSFPSFWVSVAKVVGFSRLFPDSVFFNKYYAAHIGEWETAQVDILSGCCLLVSKENLMQAGGGFDEAYFMYCEDVDMCHRLNLAGFRNIYFPEVTIVHYKGESTRKLTYSYMKVFYNAHELFVKKYYPAGLGVLFNLALKMVLGLRNVFNVVKYLLAILKIYILDALIIIGSLLLFRYYWFGYIYSQEHASAVFIKTIPVYLALWMGSLFLIGAYDKPYSLFRTGRGMMWGTLLVLAIYGLFPFELRQSRGVVVFSGLLSTIILLLSRTFFAQLGVIDLVPRGKNDFQAVIAGGKDEYAAIRSQLQKGQYRLNIVGRIFDKPEAAGDESYIGTVNNIVQIQHMLAINEIVFSARHLSYRTIIDLMQACKDKCTYKIIPEDSSYVISSQSRQNFADAYGLYNNINIGTASSKRNKRIVDILLSLATFFLFPLWLVKGKSKLLGEAWQVLLNRKTWVGYCAELHAEDRNLPRLKEGVFPPYILHENGNVPEHIREKIDYKYAREYGVLDDLQFYMKNVFFYKK